MLPPLPEFQRFQLEFTSHIRDPRCIPLSRWSRIAPDGGLREAGLQQVESFLLPCFPVVRDVLGAHRWAELVRNFLATHRSASPFFRRYRTSLSNSFRARAQYLKLTRPFCWSSHTTSGSLVFSVSNRAPDWAAIAPGGSLLLNRPALNPVLAPSYRWPVHRIGPPVDVEPAETYLLVFRDRSGDVQFTDIYSAILRAWLTFWSPASIVVRRRSK